MRNRYFNFIVATLFFLVAQDSFAQYWWSPNYQWAIASYNESQQKLVTFEYYTKLETAANGNEYYRISWLYEHQHEDECSLSRYGFAERDKRVCLYDFETGEESICMDYNLQQGEMFTTYNGETWEVIESKDTLILDSELEYLGYEKTRKVLTVSNVEDGRVDKWVEGAGSFTNFLMIEKEQAGVSSHLLWVCHDCHYIINEFSADPVFGHYTGWLPEMRPEDEKESSIEYKDGELIIDYWYTAYPERFYNCYLRQGDNVFNAVGFSLGPDFDCEKTLRNDVVHLKGLPAPASGNYSVYLGDKVLTTGVRGIKADTPKTHAIFDLQGRKLDSAPAHGIYIKDGVKRINK